MVRFSRPKPMMKLCNLIWCVLSTCFSLGFIAPSLQVFKLQIYYLSVQSYTFILKFWSAYNPNLGRVGVEGGGVGVEGGRG